MPSIFDPSDIEALIEAFPPPAPTKTQPSLVRNSAGDRILSSDAVLKRFRALIEKSTSRIKLVDLAQRLEVRDTDWLLDAYDGPLYYNTESHSLIPQGEIQRLRRKIWTTATTGLLDVITFANDSDIAIKSLDLIIEEEKKNNRPGQLIEYADPDAGKRRWVYSDRYASAMQGAIASTLSTVEGNEPIDLSHGFMFSDAPRSLVRGFTEEVLTKDDNIKGSVEQRKKSIVFVPADYADAQEAQRQSLYQTELDATLQQVGQLGYCLIPIHPKGAGQSISETRANLLRDVQSQFENDHPSSSWTVLGDTEKCTDEPIALWLSNRLDDLLEANDVTESVVTELWSSRDESKGETEIKTSALDLISEKLTTNPELSSLLTKKGTPSRAKLEESIAVHTAVLEQKDTSRAHDLLTERLLVPITLYSTGIQASQDPTLHQNLSTFLADHFRREVIPGTITTLKSGNLLFDRSRAREVEKFRQITTEAKTLPEIHTAATKLGKKLKLPASDTPTLLRIRNQTLKHKASAMRKMTRASDVLQNLIWILLAETTVKADGPALFMSSGKDTTRMIKLFQARSEAETGVRLEGWRDVLKGGGETGEAVTQMRELATQTVERILALDDGRDDA